MVRVPSAPRRWLVATARSSKLRFCSCLELTGMVKGNPGKSLPCGLSSRVSSTSPDARRAPQCATHWPHWSPAHRRAAR
jgi:hypothetical protein